VFSHITAMFVYMLFSNQDCILITNLYLFKGYTAQTLLEKFPSKLERVRSLKAAKNLRLWFSWHVI